MFRTTLVAIAVLAGCFQFAIARAVDPRVPGNMYATTIRLNVPDLDEFGIKAQ